MSSRKISSLKIGGLEAKIPIIQGGMGVGVSLSGLASAVANEGGIGVIATAGIGMHEPDFMKAVKKANNRALRTEIKKARKLTDGIIGVNIMVALTDFDDLVMASLEEGVDLIFIGAGLPLKNPQALPLDRLKLIPIVSSARAASIIFQYWANNYNYVPDAVVVEGPLAGGHLGFKIEQINDPDFKLEKLLPEVIKSVKSFEDQYNKNISVIAAGGIFTGADIHKYFQLGAQGVQMATRFVATNECDASIEFKNAYVNSKQEDIEIIQSPVGLPGRALINDFLDDVNSGMKKPFNCPWKCLKTCNYKEVAYCIALALINAKKGDLDNGFAFAGANAYKVDKIVSVKELMQTLMDEYENEIA